MRGTDWINLLILSIVWGGSFFFIEISLTALSPFTIVAVRLAAATLVLLGYNRIKGNSLPLTRATIPAFLTMGLLNNAIPFSLIVSGQQFISGSLASILNASTPFFTIIVAHIFTRDEKIRPGKLLGILLGFLGVLNLFGISGTGDGSAAPAGMVMILLAALSYAFAGVFGRRFKRMGIEPVVVASGQLSSSALMMLPVALIMDKPWHAAMPSPEVWAAMAGLSLLSTAMAYVLYFRILSSAGATSVLLVTFLVPISAIFFGVTLLGETVQIRHLAGMVMIGLGLALIDGRLFRRPAH